ncbi:OB-fold domain-containing protein [Streptomyces sp. NBC_00335]|uniref:bifunctional MaoC family dehydratase N-terminal/OB-fold nucleic acid binding domain-containing protein n=1 Tax=unclassified Streptomyces TaxID=2593676 RepID=UPI0022598832|nr:MULTISPECIES: bifunctional MaoC family dehydratase N-terminal/OB-fold nucleic acid binding domain-containing protein [unclassified Streptomyces]MCX5406091.1 OB-fold domain-containing protein [Streptomyces sp. NBC_00086]
MTATPATGAAGAETKAETTSEADAAAQAAAEAEAEAARFHTLLTSFEGQPAATAGQGKDAVNQPMIRHWCEAMGDANPAYTGPDAIAPPTMLQAWTMGGLSGHSDRSSAYDELLTLLDGAGCTSVVATDCEQEYLRPLRPGDAITFDAVIESVSPRKTTKLGTGHFVTTRMDVRANGELAGTHRFRILKYVPAAKKATGAEQPAESKNPATAKPATAQPLTAKPAPAKPAQRPRPVINRDNQGFWDGVREHKLLIQRCTACATLRFPWLPGCNTCGSPDWDTVEASGAGTVFSYVVMHHPPFPAFDPPYAVALVELAEGVRMVSNITGVPYDKVRIGLPVRLEFLRVDEELELPVFRGSEA